MKGFVNARHASAQGQQAVELGPLLRELEQMGVDLSRPFQVVPLHEGWEIHQPEEKEC